MGHPSDCDAGASGRHKIPCPTDRHFSPQIVIAMQRVRFRWLPLFRLLVLVANLHHIKLGLAQVNERLNFSREIKPVLSNNCFFCHGPDANERKGGLNGLRLDTESGAFADQGGTFAVVKGQPEKSELVRRISSVDSTEKMPPEATGKRLTEREILLLKEWIQQGGNYTAHWSYSKPVRPDVPCVKHPEWATNDIDRFLFSRLEREGMTPLAEAERHTLIRRVSLDLTGLPPTWAEVQAFVNDGDPKAYEKVVDRLLQQSSYGEHWGHMWLDLARYADSSGYADDPLRTIWPFRDYVIKSLNANKPFDQFTIEQIAGDLLPSPTDDQIIATAFHRNTLTNSEGGTNDEEFRNAAIVDRVNTTMAVWMGTTMACAQCHTHKFDPISQEEYFRFFAFFNNTDDADRFDESPLLMRFTESQLQQQSQFQTEIARLTQTLATPTPERVAGQTKWEQSFPFDITWQTPPPDSAVSTGGNLLTICGDSIITATAAKTATYVIGIPLNSLEPTDVKAVRLEALPADVLPGQGPGFAEGNFIISKITAVVELPAAIPQAGRIVRDVKFVAAFADYEQPMFEVKNVIEGKTNSGWAVGGSLGRPHSLIAIAAVPVEAPAGSKLVVTIDQSSNHESHVLGKFRLSWTNHNHVAEFAQTPAVTLAILNIQSDLRTDAQKSQLAKHYVSIAPELETDRSRLAMLTQQLAELKPAMTVPIMKELAENLRRKTQIQHRGNFLDLGQEVTEGIPATFHPLPQDAPKNRLTLARWLIDSNNPLTARVIANRFWEQIFGIGIVSTSEEFGAQGDQPYHPELLDWLATELVARQWDMKSFLKLLVMSAAYRQSSMVTPELYERDPENRLLARGPRFRLSAEMIRDQALALAGLLSPKMYGPSAKPPQPISGLTAAFGSGIDWQTSSGEDKFRRGLYTEWRRSNPYPSMSTFDAPNREVCTVRRSRTNTPLQALVTLNDPVYVEAAQALARRIAVSGLAVGDKALFAFRQVTSRNPTDEELNRLVKLFDAAHEQLQKQTTEAQQLATEPLGPAPHGAEISELAAWTVVGNVLFNLDEMLMKR
jgi:hypothetical protein